MNKIELQKRRERVRAMRNEISRKHNAEYRERVRNLKEQGFSMKETSRELGIQMHMVSSLWQEFEKESE